MRGQKKRWMERICLALVLAGLLWSGCGSVGTVSHNAQKEHGLTNREFHISDVLTYESSMELAYATQFAVDRYQGGYKLITIADGSRYLVVPEGKEVPKQLDEDVVVLQQPINQVYLVASAAMDPVCKLEALSHIRFSGQKAEGWCVEEARAAMERGDLLYAGKYSMPDYEQIVAEGCSLAIENNMISHSPEVMEKLESFGIPVLIDQSSYESHPLGRVEWVKLYGVLFQKEALADALFAEQIAVVDRVTAQAPSGKTVAFFYFTANGLVNVRQASDYVPKMIGLAGGQYVFEDLGGEESNRSSVSIQMEQFYNAAKDADYLIYNSTIDGELESLAQLLEKESLLQDFKAVKEGHVWCTTRDLYQQSMSIGGMIEDLHGMLSGEEKGENMQYLYPLQ